MWCVRPKLHYLLLWFIFFVHCGRATSAEPTGNSYPPIQERDFLQRIGRGQTITHYTVAAALLKRALVRPRPARKPAERPGIALENCRVTGVLSLSGQTIDRPLTLDQCAIGGNFDFTRCQFLKNVTLTKVTVSDPDGDSFRFSECEFKDESHFETCTFSNGTDFQASRFHSNTSFAESTFAADSLFEKADFEKSALFRKARFNTPVDFQEATFGADAIFEQANFNDAHFIRVTFQGNATFDDAIFRHSKPLGAGGFNDTYRSDDFDSQLKTATFKKKAYFRGVEISGSSLDFDGTVFENDVYLTNLYARSSDIRFSDVTFKRRLYLDNSEIRTLIASTYSPGQPDVAPKVSSGRRPRAEHKYSSTTFEQPASFNHLKCDYADFQEAEFRNAAFFSSATFRKVAKFDSAVFNGPAFFRNAAFPSRQKPARTKDQEELKARIDKAAEYGLYLDNVRFSDDVELEWDQLAEPGPTLLQRQGRAKIVTSDAATWELLEHLFKAAGDLDGQNECLYRQRLLKLSLKPDWPSRFSCLFWGFGLRPWRLLFWLGTIFVLFTIVYWTQTKPLGSFLQRLRYALLFSYQTSWKVGFGVENSKTTLFKLITALHSLLIKVMLICLLNVLSNVSPLINSLVGKLLHL